jgi:two-component system response regulator HydG
VRELEHAIEHAVVLTQRDLISATDLPFSRPQATLREMPVALGGRSGSMGGEGTEANATGVIVAPSPRFVFAELAELPYAEAKKRLVSSFDEAYTAELLRRASGNMSEASRLAGLDRSNFRRLLKRKEEG